MDPYTESLRIPRPRDRKRDPHDPREPYTREYTTLPIPDPFPSTGSFNFRQGVYNQRSMTVQEQNFEQLVNNRQAEHDISSYLDEWERLKALEEEAIQLWQELDGNLAEYQRQMRTRDQQAMEFQCQRKKVKIDRLNKQAESSRYYEQVYLAIARRRSFQEDVERRASKDAEERRASKEAEERRACEEAEKRRASKEAEERRACEEAEKRRSFNEDVQQRAIESASRRASEEAVKRSATESTARSTFMEAEKREAMKAAKCKAFTETVKRKLAESEPRNTTNVAAATNAQPTPSQVASATDGIPSDLGSHLESSGESSHSPVPQQSGSTDSVSRDIGSPSLPTNPPIDNTAQPPRISPRQPPTLMQSRQNSSNSPSPPRSTSVDDSTPPSSQHPSRSQSSRSSPPTTPPASRFEADPAIWGTSIQASSSNQPLQLPSLSPSPQLPSLDSSQTNTPRVPFGVGYFTRRAQVASMQYQPQLGHDVPTHGAIRTVEEMRRRFRGRGIVSSRSL